MPVTEGTSFALTHCYFRSTFVNGLLTRTNQSWFAITGMFWVAGLLTGEIHLLSITIGSLVNIILQYAIMWVVREPVADGQCGTENKWCVDPLVVNATCDPEPWPWFDPPPGSGCVPCGFPAQTAQLYSFLVVCFYFYRFAWHTGRLDWLISFIVLGFMSLTAFAHIYVGYNTPMQFAAGTLFGSTFGAAWSWFTFIYLYPRYYWFIQHPWVRLFVRYKNTFACSTRPVPGDPKPFFDVVVENRELFLVRERPDKKDT
jgi:hypothetical protein